MNYNNEILENKAFNFFKQLMYNLALSICIILVGVVVMVYVFKFNLYKVESDSQAPYFYRDDIVVVKAQEKYVPGDILKFDLRGTPITHRLVAVIEEGGKTYYLCHGDNVQNFDNSKANGKWEDEAAYVKQLQKENYSADEIIARCANVQTPTLEQIEGKVVASMRHYGAYIEFIKGHYMLFISLVAGIWCISSVAQNEIEIKKTRRLF